MSVTPVIAATRHYEDLRRGRDGRQCIARRERRHCLGRVPRDHGRFRQRQEHAHAHHRLPRRADRGPVFPRRCGGREPRLVRARCGAQPQDRLRVPELQPHSPHDRDRECRTTVGLCGREEGRAPRTRAPRVARGGRVGRSSRPCAESTLRWATTTRRGRAGDGHEPFDHSRRRTHWRTRQRIDERHARSLRRPA